MDDGSDVQVLQGSRVCSQQRTKDDAPSPRGQSLSMKAFGNPLSGLGREMPASSDDLRSVGIRSQSSRGQAARSTASANRYSGSTTTHPASGDLYTFRRLVRPWDGFGYLLASPIGVFLLA